MTSPTPSPAAVTRIKASVRWTEARRLNLGGPARRPLDRPDWFFARIIPPVRAEYPDATGPWPDHAPLFQEELGWGEGYSWVRVGSNAAGSFVDVQPFATGGNAWEANGNRELLYGAVVLLVLAGATTGGQPLYLFERLTPTTLPPRVHHHIGEVRGQGGFSFSVHHPATALPQPAWAI